MLQVHVILVIAYLIYYVFKIEIISILMTVSTVLGERSFSFIFLKMSNFIELYFSECP